MRAVQQLQLKGQSYTRFISAQKSSFTRLSYVDSFKRYSEFLQSIGVITDATDSDSLLVHPDIVENWLMAFIDSMRKQKLARATIETRLAACKLFYDMNKVTLAWKLIRKTYGEKTINEDRPYEHDEIKRLLAVADERARVGILLMASAGLRVGAVVGLRYGNLKPINDHGIYKITVYEKTHDKYTTFCTPECRDAIDAYIDRRKRDDEKIDANSPLLRQQYNRRRTENQKVIPLTRDGLLKQIRMALVLSGLRDGHAKEGKNLGTNRYDIKASHGFRKFFDTQASLAGIAPLYTGRLMGHDQGLQDVYIKISDEQLLEGTDNMLGYVAAIDALTINNENKLQRKVTELEVKATAYDMLAKRMDALEARQK